MYILIITLLIIVSLGFVVYPLVTRRPESEASEELAQQATQQLRQARERIYEEIRAMQQEYFLAHMPKEEYQARLAEARVQAATLLQQQEQVQETLAQAEAAVEAQIERITGVSSSSVDSQSKGRDIC
jgi:crotonobetainyl-CoA:carnitine CoA-transferase CaiB-like acyl-CoA transferase